MKQDSDRPAGIVRAGLCIGCGVCAESEPAAMQFDWRGNLKPAPSFARHPVAGFVRRCPFSSSAPNEDQIAGVVFPDVPVAGPATGRMRAGYVGHVAEDSFREQGSSGGLVTWMLCELLSRGLVDGVAHVAPGRGALFEYRISRSAAAVREGSRSRYFPVHLAGILQEIRRTPGRYAIVGVPCFIKALRLLQADDPVLRERLAFLLGLVCGHMKSSHFAESLAWQMDAEIAGAAAFDFRRKDPTRAANVYTAEVVGHDGRTARRDWWNMPDGDWGAGFFQNPACNFCDDVLAETADASFGDAWVEPYSSDGRGTNVLVVRSHEIQRLVDAARAGGRLTLQPASEELIARTQEAGLRHRREGLAYRLTWQRDPPPKRVRPNAADLSLRRRLVYRCRAAISAMSPWAFAAARRLRWRGLYLGWARAAAAVYGGVAYGRGWWGRAIRRIGVQ